MPEPSNLHEFVRIRFIRTWGHPTKNLICGVGTFARVSRYLCGILVKEGYAVEEPRQ
jgi:hypothetical protein